MTTLQSQVNVTLAFLAESVLGTPASQSGAQFIRRVSSSLVLAKESFASNEARVDQQVFDMRHGSRQVPGSIEGELSLETYDAFIEAVLRGTWAAGATKTQTEFTSIAASASGSTFTFAAGDPVAEGLRLNDMFRLTGCSETLNNNVNFRITAFGGTTNRTVSVTPAPTDMSADTSFSLAVTGKKLAMGVTKRSFTIEQKMGDIDTSELFKGCRIGQMALRVAPSGMVTSGFTVLGQDSEILEGTNSPYFTSPTAETNTGILSGVDGALRINGEESGVVTALDLTVNCNLSMQPVIGRTTAPEIFYGRSVVTGNVSAYLQNSDLIDAFINEDEIDLVAVLEAAGDAPQGFMSFIMPRVKLSTPSKTIGAEGGVIAQFPFQALLKSGTGYDTSSLVIQRSNS